MADHLRMSFCHVNEPCEENLDYFSWLSDLHAQTTCVWLIRNLGVSRWISFSFPIEHFSSHSCMFRTVATVKILLYLMYVLLYIQYVYTYPSSRFSYASLKIDTSPCDLASPRSRLVQSGDVVQVTIWEVGLSHHRTSTEDPVEELPMLNRPIWSDRESFEKREYSYRY